MHSNSAGDSSSGRSAPALRHLGRKSVLTLAMVAALICVVVLSTAKPAAEAAEPAAGVTYSPGDVSWEVLDDGRCITTQSVEVKAPSVDEAKQLSSLLSALPAKTDFPAESGITDAHANVGVPINTDYFPVTLHAYLPGDKCKAADTAQVTLFDTEGGGDLDTVQLAAAPTWLKGAIAAVVGAAVFIAVSTMVTAGITATGVLVGATATTIAAVTAVSGCIGGATSTAVTLALAGAGGGWKQNLANAAAGCATGAAVGLLPIKTVGEAAGNAIRGALGFAPAATVGAAGVVAAESAGVELAGITEVVGTASDALVAVE